MNRIRPAAAPITPLSLAPNEHDELARSGALAVTAGGEEVLAGLSAEESDEYLRFLRDPREDDEAAQARHLALTLKLERARLQRSAEAPDGDPLRR